MDKELLSAAMSGNRRQLARILKLNNRSYDINCLDSVSHLNTLIPLNYHAKLTNLPEL